MKRVLFFLMILSLFVGRLFATGETSLKVQSLINKGLFKNKMEIMSLAPNLSSSEKEALIGRNKINGYFPMYMSSGLGYGIGSFLTKDYVGGAIHCAIDVTCDVIMISMFAIYAKSVFGFAEAKNGIDDTFNKAKSYLYAGIGTALILIVNRIAQVISLTVHINRYNNTLADIFTGTSSINNAKTAVNLIPIVEENRFGLGLNFAIPKRTS